MSLYTEGRGRGWGKGRDRDRVRITVMVKSCVMSTREPNFRAT